MSKDSLARPADVLRPRHVGAPIKRTEDPRLLTGSGEYAADRKPDRALHVAFRRSEQPHARILRIDTAAAQTAPGVIAVFMANPGSEGSSGAGSSIGSRPVPSAVAKLSRSIIASGLSQAAWVCLYPSGV